MRSPISILIPLFLKSEEEEFDYKCLPVFDNEDTEEATEDEEFDYYGPPIFDSEGVEEAVEKEEFFGW